MKRTADDGCSAYSLDLHLFGDERAIERARTDHDGVTVRDAQTVDSDLNCGSWLFTSLKWPLYVVVG